MINNLPDNTKIAHVHLKVTDIRRALEFYQDRLGFSLAHRQNGTAYLASAPGQPTSLVLTEDRHAEPKPSRTTGLYHFAIRFPGRADLASTLMRLLEQGWRFLGAADHGVSEALYTTDPDGNGVELYVDRPPNRWPREKGQIAMISEPLDINGLLGVKGAGMNQTIAAGADVGHVHLQVSDLERSRHFYQDLLGLNVTQSDYPGALFLAAGNYHHHLGINVWAGEGAPHPPSSSVGLISFGLVIPNKDAWVRVSQRLEGAGYAVQSLETAMCGVAFIVNDPDGNGVELIFPG